MHGPRCSNCDTAIGADARFCQHCGQKTRYGARTVRDIVQEVAGRDYASDGRLLLTLCSPLVPGRLTQDWFAGRQQRYLGPLRR